MVTQGLCCLLVAVCGQVVEDDDGAGGDLGDEHLSDVGGKGGAIHCTLDDPWRDQGIWCQPSDQRLRSPVSEGRVHRQALPPLGPATQAREVRLHGGFVNEDNAFWQGGNGRQAVSEPAGPLLSYLGSTALGGNQRLFLYVNPSRDSRLAMEEWCTCTPSASASASRNSKSVMSGSWAISSSRKA